MKFRELPAAQFGRYGETIAARMLRNLGAGVIATFKFSGENDNEAPAIELSEKRIVLADLDVSLRGRTISVEIKTYAEPQFNRSHHCLVHGIPTRLFDEYCASERERGIPVHLGVLEVSSGSLIVSDEPISKMSPRYACQCENQCESVRPGECAFRAKWGSSYPQWYFRRDSFREWHRLEGDALKALQAEHARIASSIKRAHHRPDLLKPQLSAPWTWAHLICNATGRGSPNGHRCEPQEYMRRFWIDRLRWVRDANGTQLGAERAAKLIEQPIQRSALVALLGPRWLPEADIGMPWSARKPSDVPPSEAPK